MNANSFSLPSDVHVLAGASGTVVCRIAVPFASEVMSALDSLSKRLLAHPSVREFPDIVTFAFWCRRANLAQKESVWRAQSGTYPHVGRGLVFHVAPSNVPINFAYSFVFSLLAGNSNIVRVPSKDFAQVTLVCSAINEVFAEYSKLLASNSFVRYASEGDTTAQISACADGRVLWGGDATVSHIRALPSSPRCIDIAFPDRYSIALISADSVACLDEASLQALAAAFYNDTYLMDQNACSSPQVLFWVDDNKDGRERFWQALTLHAQEKYDLQSAVSVDKYVKLCEDTLQGTGVGSAKTYNPYLTHVDITDRLQQKDSSSLTLSDFRGTGGYFYEAAISSVGEALAFVSQKYQTLVYFGLNPLDLAEALIATKAQGIDRIVPIGEALSIDIIWDGYDLIGQLSRIIEVR